jgi:hypothetical protein
MQELDDVGTRALLAVQRLQATYGDAVTRRDWAAVHELFAPDAVVHIDTRTRPPLSLEGPDALVAFVEQALEAYVFFELTILNAVSEVHAHTATGRVYIGEVRLDRSGVWSQAYGLYSDEYVRLDGDWRIGGRRYASLARTGPPAESFPMPG